MLNGEKSPWRSKPTPPGPRGLHPVGALVRTYQGLEHKTQSQRELLRAKSHQNLRESARTAPEARGLLSDTTRRGTLSKNQKYCLSLAKNQKSKPKDNHEVSADSPIRPRLAPRPQTKGQSPPPHRGPLAEAPSPRPRPAMPQMGYQFSDSPEAGLGNNLVTFVPTDSPDKTPRPVNTPHYSRKRQPHVGTVQAE